jgi:hypothetical protein
VHKLLQLEPTVYTEPAWSTVSGSWCVGATSRTAQAYRPKVRILAPGFSTVMHVVLGSWSPSAAAGQRTHFLGCQIQTTGAASCYEMDRKDPIPFWRRDKKLQLLEPFASQTKWHLAHTSTLAFKRTASCVSACHGRCRSCMWDTSCAVALCFAADYPVRASKNNGLGRGWRAAPRFTVCFGSSTACFLSRQRLHLVPSRSLAMPLMSSLRGGVRGGVRTVPQFCCFSCRFALKVFKTSSQRQPGTPITQSQSFAQHPAFPSIILSSRCSCDNMQTAKEGVKAVAEKVHTGS